MDAPDPRPAAPAAAPAAAASFRAIVTTVDAIDAHPDALHRIYAGELDVLILRGVLGPDTLRDVVGRLERGETTLPRTLQESTDAARVQTYVLGDIITPNAVSKTGPPIDRYLAAASGYREGLRELFRGHEDFEATLRGVFTRLAGGRRVDVPVHPSGITYTPTTIRCVPPGCRIPLHVGNYFLNIESYRHLSTIIDLYDQLSFFMPLAVPEGGGGLTVYDVEYGAPDVPMNGQWVDEAKVVATVPSQLFEPGAGDLLLFDGGRYYHRVEQVTGARARWTIGGFLAFARDEHAVYFWS